MNSDRSPIWLLLFSVIQAGYMTKSDTLLPPTQKCGEDLAQKDLNSFLWLVNRTPPAYFFGTIHVPYTRVWDYIPLNSKEAFDSSRHVYFELDLTNESMLQAEMRKCKLLPNKGRLKDVLPKRLYKRLKRHLHYIRKKMAVWLKDLENDFQYASYADNLYRQLTKNWYRKRPIWVMLMVNSLTESDIKSRGIPVLDQYLAGKAVEDRKETGAVESVEEQCRPLNALNTTQVIFALNQSLSLQERIRYGKAKMTYTTDDLVNLYNCGDLNSVLYQTQTNKVLELRENSTLEERDLQRAQEIQSHLTQELIFKRNEQMAKRVKELLNKHHHRSFFFAFGAGHFLGNHSIIDILRKEGYGIRHLKPDQRLPKSKRKKTVSGSRQCRRVFRKGRPCKRRKRRRKKFTTVAPDMSFWSVNLLTSKPKEVGENVDYRNNEGEATIIKKVTNWRNNAALIQGNIWRILLQIPCLLLFRWIALRVI